MADENEVLGPGEGGGLRRAALRAGLYLVGRHGLDVTLALVAEPLIARLVGPFSYGVWIAAQRVFLYLALVFALGIDVYLVRKEGETDANDYHQAFTLLLLLGIAGAGTGLLAIPILRKWIAIEGFGAVATTMVIALPVVLSTRVPMARLERALDYRSVAIIEVSGRLLFYVVVVALAFLEWGVWAIVVGFWMQLALNAALALVRARYRPRLTLKTEAIRRMVGYGAGFSTAVWVYRLHNLVNPLVVGRFAGAEAVGYVGLAERIVNSVGFVRNAGWRLSLAVLGRVQDSKERMARAVDEGIRLQVMALGPLLLAVGFALPLAAVALFGEKWKPLPAIYPFVAVEFLVATIFALQSSALSVMGRNYRLAACNAVHVLLFAILAELLVRRIGWLGYGWAALAAMPAFWLVHRLFVREVGGRLDYRLTGGVAAACAMGLFWQQLGWISLLGFIALAVWPLTWRTLKVYALQLGALRYG